MLPFLFILSLSMGGHHSKTYHENGAIKTYKGITYDSSGVRKDSVFQQIADGGKLPGNEDSLPEERRLLFEDRRCVAFVPLNAGSNDHILIVPREPGSRFVGSVADLTANDIELLEHMEKVGITVIEQRRIDGTVSAEDDKPPHGLFHRPPFNSIDHLHLHFFGSSQRRRFIDKIKYPHSFDTPWCISLDTAFSRLGRRRSTNEAESQDYIFSTEENGDV